MEMQHVRYFIALAETLNFTRAAERCNVTQPALTRAIQSLEDELGGPLFHRERANTHLTELGRMMHPYFSQILGNLSEAKSRAQSYGQLEATSLAIGAMCTIGPPIICEMIGGFRHSNPGVELEVRDLASDGLCEDLAKGEVEAAIYGYPEANDDRFHYVPLYQERFVIAVSENHEFAKKNIVQGSDLHGAAYVCRSRCEIYEYARKKFNDNGIFVKPVFKSERDDWVIGMVRAGFGFGFFPEFSAINTGLQIRPLIEPDFVRTIYLLTVRGRPHSPAVGAFVRQAKMHHWPQASDKAFPN